MADKLILRPPGLLESKLSTSSDSAASDGSQQERPDFFSGVRKGIKKLGSISTGPKPTHPSTTERSNSSLDAHQSSNIDRPVAPKKGHTRSTSDLGKPLPATPASPTIEQLLRAPFSPPYTPQAASSTSRSTAVNGSRTSTMDSTTSEASSIYTTIKSSANISDLNRSDGDDDRREETSYRNNLPSSTAHSPGPKPRTSGNGIVGTSGGSSQHLSGLMCNVHRTTGREPPPLVGATTTVLGDKLYVFGGRILSRTRPVLTADLYELDLIQRHWLKLKATGDIPPPRYFHSVCALGDTRLVCYGGMSPAPAHAQGQAVAVSQNPDSQPEVVVMSDIYIYDAPRRRWTFIPTQDTPQGRYAHCTTILPSSATFCTGTATTPASHISGAGGSPNLGSISAHNDGTGGAEMVVVGGQDSTNHYIEQISVFNLRSMRWTSTQQLGKSCGAYRSVVAPLSSRVLSRLGKSSPLVGKTESNSSTSQDKKEPGSSMLIYSNYNFLDVKLELQIRSPDGALTEKPMQGTFSPPGLRFPNGGVIDTNFVVSGTYLTSSKQEYALWALDLRTLTWSRIDAGGSVFSQGSWNRGVLWNRRNTFVILGSRKRSLVEDYNHRRINFTNVCMVELEAFGLYDNPRKVAPMSSFISASSPFSPSMMKLAIKTGWSAGGRTLSAAAEELGQSTLGLRQLADIEILCVDGERVPVNSRILAKRWGPYFIRLLQDGAATQDYSDADTLRPNHGLRRDRDSSITITPGIGQSSSLSPSPTPTLVTSSSPTGISQPLGSISALITPPDVTSLPPSCRPRILYLPHTKLTVQAMLYYLYTAALPPSTSSLCTPQILCSLLQIARPYQIDGLLESVVERLHGVLDSRNAAAVFNASAMAAGGRSTTSTVEYWIPEDGLDTSKSDYRDSEDHSIYNGPGGPRVMVSIPTGGMGRSIDEDDTASATESADSDLSSSDLSSRSGRRRRSRPVWSGGVSAVIGLQKRGLRGLMEGRRLRERGASIGVRDGQGGKVSSGSGIAG